MPIVTVTQPSVIRVQVNNQRPTVQSINYGSKTIRGSTDLKMSGAQTGDVITYNAANNDFVIQSVTSTITDIDAGLF